MQFVMLIEKSLANDAAYIPDVPGCLATITTLDETETLIREAMAFHIEGFQVGGQPAPPFNSQVE